MFSLLFTCAIILLFSLSISITATEYGCLYGWNLRDDNNSCFIHCVGASRVYCDLNVLRSVDATYDSISNTLSMPSGIKLSGAESHLPSCYTVTLDRDQYRITPDDLLDIGINYLDVADYKLSSNTSNATFCYQLTPQLLQCDTDVTDYGLYYIVNGTELRIPSKNVTAYLGDFYIMENGSAVTCVNNVNIDHVQFNNKPRCNYLTITPEDITIDEAGAMLITLANFTIKNPAYSVVIGQVLLVCIPLALEFGNCPKLEYSADYFYEKESNLNIYNILQRVTFTPDSYYITIKKVMTFCYTFNIAFDFFAIIGFAACVCLIFTLLIRLKFFLQNYHCKCLMCHIIAFIMMWMSFVPRQAFLKMDEIGCDVLLIIFYYFVMAMYTWLNIISYDSWRHFSKLQTTPKHFCKCSLGRRPKSLKSGLFRFIIYSIYGWGLPAILTTTVITFGFESSPYNFHNKFIPFINPGCNFTNINAFAIYFFLPGILFTTVTIVFLIMTIRVIRAVSRGTELVNQQRRSQIFRLSMKMIVVMGLCWPINSVFYFPTTFKPELIRLWFGALIVVMVQGFVITFIYFDRNETLKLFQSIRRNITAFITGTK